MRTEPDSRRAFLRRLAAFLGQGPTFSGGVKVVNVFATVRNRDGQIVKDLQKDDFALNENGRPQVIRYFARQSDLPLTIGLLVDTSFSERRMIGIERAASVKFLRQVLRPDRDKAFLIRFDGKVELLQDLTASRERLEEALDLLRGAPSGGGTAFYDAIYLAADEVLSGQIGRKALILLTDGEDNASKVTIDEAIGASQRAEAIGYAVRITDEEIGSMVRGWRGPDGTKTLKQIARHTGGGYFEFGKKKPLEGIYAEIEDELRNQYSLGYTSNYLGEEKGFRRIEVKVRRKGLSVQARDGYYA